jgi:hypothetical protein
VQINSDEKTQPFVIPCYVRLPTHFYQKVTLKCIANNIPRLLSFAPCSDYGRPSKTFQKKFKTVKGHFPSVRELPILECVKILYEIRNHEDTAIPTIYSIKRSHGNVGPFDGTRIWNSHYITRRKCYYITNRNHNKGTHMVTVNNKTHSRHRPLVLKNPYTRRQQHFH